MSLITWREFKGEQIPILSVPKGTVLFRSMFSKDLILSDFVGIPADISEHRDATDYCLSPYHNVFFYTYPYIIDTNRYAEEEEKMHMVMYVTTTDINVVLLLKPSPYIRWEKTENIFSEKCSYYSYCGVEGRPYDRCLTDDFMKENLDVCGMIGVQASDANNFNKKWVKSTFEPLRKFMTFMWDAGNTSDRENSGPPELALYPLRMRNLMEVKTVIKDSESPFEYVSERIDQYNYFPFQDVYHRFLETDDKLYKMLNMMFSPKGYKEKNVVHHLTIDKRTCFYMLYEETDDDIKNYLVDLKENNKLSVLQFKNKLLQLPINSPFKIKKLIKKLA